MTVSHEGSMVERVARALFVANWDPPYAYMVGRPAMDYWDEYADEDHYRDLARAAIEAYETAKAEASNADS